MDEKRRRMSADEQRLDLPPMAQNHEVITARDDVGDGLTRGGEDRILIAVDLNEVGMLERALPNGGPWAGPADEPGIRPAKHLERPAAEGIQQKGRKGQPLDDAPRDKVAKMPEETKSGLELMRIRAGGHQRHLGDGDQPCDLACEHASEGHPDE